jgi:regulator of nucleoside diphosphate kinase
MNLPCLTQLDVLRLERHVRVLNTEAERERIDDLLATAHIVPGEEVPDDVVTMNSHVVYRDLATQMAHEVTLVYPELADSTLQRLSVTSAVGVALLGARLGEEVNAVLPNGQQRQLQILAVPFQPEAAGQFHL